jgi:hypothetical protein
MNRQIMRVVAGACILAATTACYDLSVATTDDALTRDAIISDPSLVDRVIAGVGINLWAGIHNTGNPHVGLAILGEELTSASNNFFAWDVGREPRIALDNQAGTPSFSRDPWSNLYEANAAATEMQRVIAQQNMRIIDPATGFDNTTRDIVWGKFVQGASHAYLAILFDQAAIVNTQVDLSEVPNLPFVPYTEVRDSALKWLREAATLAENNVFQFPYTDALWFWNSPLSNGEFAQIIHSFIARLLVYSTRDPAEREALDWNEVLTHLNKSITLDFGPGADGSRPNPLLTWGYKIRAFNPPNTAAVPGGSGTTNTSEARVDLRLLGPADTVRIDTDNDAVPDKYKYQVWLEKVDAPGRDTVAPFDVISPDRRIARPGQVTGSGFIDPTPVFFRHTAVVPPVGTQDPTRGLYYRSPYWSASRTNGKTGRNTTGNFDDIKDIGITVVEMDMLKAEAYIRLGGAANLATAATLINRTRVANGGLPPVTAAGPPQATAAEQASCVPRRFDGTCANLFQSMMYEKRVEAFGTHAVMVWADLRGWGCLLEGSPTELPIPARQLDLLQRDVYTFGGQPGQRGSAPVPDDCPLLVNPNVRGNG